VHHYDCCQCLSDKFQCFISVINVVVVVVVGVCVVVIDRVQDQLEAAKPGPLVDEVVGIYSHLFTLNHSIILPRIKLC